MDYVQEMMAAWTNESFPPRQTIRYSNCVNKQFHVSNARWRYKMAKQAFIEGQYRRAKEFFEIVIKIMKNICGDCKELLGVELSELIYHVHYLNEKIAMLQNSAPTAA